MGRPKNIANIYNPPKSNTQFIEGHKSKGILDDFAVRKSVQTNQIEAESTQYPVLDLRRKTTATGGAFDTLSGIASAMTLRTKTSGNMTNGFGGGIVFLGADAASGDQTWARIYARRDSGDSIGALQFWGGSNAGTPLMTLRGNGNVGIGTTNPSKKLDINGGANIDGTITSKESIISGATDATLIIRSGAGTYDTAIKFYEELTPKWYIGVDGSASNMLVFGTGSTIGSNRLMYMTSSSIYYTEGASFEGDCVINGGKFELTSGSRITINPTITFTDQDTTPDVGSGNSFITNNGRATTITKFDSAKGDQVFTIICNDANTTIQNNANIALSGSANFVMASGDTLTMLYSEALSKCIEIGRMIS